MSDKKEILQTLDEKPAIATPYTTPENYFNALEQRIIDKVEKEYLCEWPNMAHEATFKVSTGYFDKLEPSIAQRLKDKAYRRLIWYKLSAAAIITGIIAFGILQLDRPTRSQLAERTISSPEIRKINSTELAEFAEDGVETYSGAAVNKKAFDANQLFQGVSNQELQNFLNENAVGDSDLF